MPTVTYGTRRVRRGALPGVRLTAAETPTSQGAGLERARAGAAGTLADVGGALARQGLGILANIEAQERRHADQVARLKWQQAFSEFETTQINDPEQGALSRRGEAAFSLPEEVDEAFNKLASNLAAELGTDEQRVAFEQDRLTFHTQIALTVRRHVRNEMQTYEANLLNSRVENAKNAAIANSDDIVRISQELRAGVTALETHGRNVGLSDEQVEEQVGAFRTQVHAGVIGRMVANGKDRTARVYYDEVKDQIDGDARARIEEALNEGTNRRIAQEAVEQILADGGTLTEQRNRAKALDLEPEVLDDVLARLEHEATIADRAKREALEQSMTASANILERTNGDIASIPADIWASYEPAVRSSLRSYARQIADAGDVETDLPTYYALERMAMNDPDGFYKVNLLTYIDKLGRTEFKELTNLQAMIRNGQREAAADALRGFSTTNQILEGALAEWGIDPDADPMSEAGVAAANVQRLLDQRIESLGGIDKVTNTQIRQELDAILSSQAQVRGGFFSRIFGVRQTRPTVFLTIDDVPAEDRAAIEAALRARHVRPTDSAIVNAYREAILEEQEPRPSAPRLLPSHR